jgi:hypothetical protein
MNRSQKLLRALVLAAWGMASPAFVDSADLAVQPPPETAFRHDTGPAAGPAREAGLERLGQLRLRRSDEINGSPWGVSCHWIAKMESADPSVSIDLFVRSLLKLGATRQELGRIIARPSIA